MQQRTKQRIREIDQYLKDHYNEDGATACATALNEPRGYISSRAWYLKIPADKPRTRCPVQRKPRQSKSASRIAELESRLYELRKGLMIVTAENHRLQNENRQLQEELYGRTGTSDKS
jgi:hypothetical protein